MKFQIFTRTVWRNAIRTFIFLLLPAYSFGQATCATATLLSSSSSCSALTGQTLRNGNATAAADLPSTLAPCGSINANSPDRWYRFVANTAYPQITVGSVGNDLRGTTGSDGDGAVVHLYAGTCGSFTTVACNTNTSTTVSLVPGGAGLNVGATYYIRVSTNNNTLATPGGDNTSWGFSICVSEPGRTVGAGNSYVNVSKRSIGGIVQTGDTLEIRSSFYWHNTYDGTANFNRARFYDSVPTHTVMLTPLNPAGDTLLRVITNEGLTVGSNKFSYANNDDLGAYNSNPGTAGRYQIRMNFGTSSGNTHTNAATAGNLTDATGAGTVNPNNTLPIASTGTLVTFSYYVEVTGAIGDTIQLAASKFSYRKGTSAVDTVITGTPYKIYISPFFNGLCPNSTSVNVASEFAGTFGSGTTKDRPTVLTAPIPAYSWRSNVSTTNSINDGYYGIVNNLSPTGSTNVSAYHVPTCTGAPAGSECSNRMHNGHWDIMGDHTGAANPVLGNPPVAPGATGGYMLAVNADMVMSEAFRQTLTGLCPGTYYEYSAWVKNVCTTCGINVSGTSTNLPGVLPNLTFSVDGLDYYSSGAVGTGGWMKKGFIFQTGADQSEATIAIRNNAPGGGGNDWVMDDITIATCLPNMDYSPSANPIVCRLNAFNIFDTVRSFFNNYVYYKWQKSINSGSDWTDVTATLGPATPTWNGTEWEYWTFYSISPFDADLSNNGDLYRVVAATTPDNLNSTDCVYTDGIAFLTLNVLNCGTPLKTDILSFNGKLVGDLANLSWTSSREEEPVKYLIERSIDGNSFSLAGTVNGNHNSNSVNYYSFVDPLPVNGKVHYRLVIEANDNKKYSRTVLLSKQDDKNFAIGKVVNPFNQVLDFDIIAPGDMKVDAELLDMFGKVVKRQSYMVRTGTNMLYMSDTESLPAGTYILRVKNNNQWLTKKVLKGNYL